MSHNQNTTNKPQKVALHHIHQKLNAKIIEFAGFLMPVRYSSDIEEHKAVRESVGVFDVSHMGEFLLKGKQALDLVQKVTSNDASKLKIGGVQYSCLPNETGGIVDDLLVYKLAEEEYLLVVNASNIEKDRNHILKYNDFGVEFKDISDAMSLLAIQGQNAIPTLQKLTDINLAEMKYYTFQKGTFAGIENVLISATGYTGAGGFEVYVPNEFAEKIWSAIFEAGEEFNIKPIGLGARDTLRLEMGYCLYGNDIDDTTSPLEAGLGWITKFTKNFINSENLQKQKIEGVTRRLIGFELEDRGIARKDYEIQNAEGEKIGIVTSGSLSPMLNKGIGLGYVQKEFVKAGTSIQIQVRNRKLKAKVVKLPIYKK